MIKVSHNQHHTISTYWSLTQIILLIWNSFHSSIYRPISTHAYSSNIKYYISFLKPNIHTKSTQLLPFIEFRWVWKLGFSFDKRRMGCLYFFRKSSIKVGNTLSIPHVWGSSSSNFFDLLSFPSWLLFCWSSSSSSSLLFALHPILQKLFEVLILVRDIWNRIIILILEYLIPNFFERILLYPPLLVHFSQPFNVISSLLITHFLSFGRKLAISCPQ